MPDLVHKFAGRKSGSDIKLATPVLFVIALMACAVFTNATWAGDETDYASMDREVLEILARNQARAVVTARATSASLAKQLDVVEQARDELTTNLADAHHAIKELRGEVERLATLIEDDPEAKARMGLQEAIDLAIKNHKLVVGMTLDQANASMGYDGEMITSDIDSQAFEWKRYGESRDTVRLNHPVPHTNRAITRGSVAESRLKARMKAESNLAEEWKNKGKSHYVAYVADGTIIRVDRYEN